MKKGYSAIVTLMVVLCMASCVGARAETLTYAVFPYLPDPGYYQRIIERRWAEVEPDIPLVRAELDCYADGAPEGIDVVMFDAVMLESLVDAGWIQPIDPKAERDSGDIFPFALEGLAAEGGRADSPVRAKWRAAVSPAGPEKPVSAFGRSFSDLCPAGIAGGR